jgi:hypothetical protein
VSPSSVRRFGYSSVAVLAGRTRARETGFAFDANQTGVAA